jgi:hypothetical protein
MGRTPLLEGIRRGRVAISYNPNGERLEVRADTTGDGNYASMIGDNHSGFAGKVSFRVDIERQRPPEEDPCAVAETEVSRDVVSQFDFEEVESKPNEEAFAQKKKCRGKYLLVLIKNGEPHRAWKLKKGGQSVFFNESVEEGDRAYFRVELLGKPEISWLKRKIFYGKFLALTNPIYFNY